ncbi:5-carboxymethyl-2-hydroxymuconate Delta-isomerase [Streptomyces sp. NPDC002577]
MPHITIDYSPRLADVFDRQAFVRELHPMVVEEAGSNGVCKTFIRRAGETYVGDVNADGDGDGRMAFIHVEVGLLPGRPDVLKARLSEDALALLAKHLHLGDGHEVVSSVEVRDLDHAYRLSHTQT